jgi:hypothetical protein
LQAKLLEQQLLRAHKDNVLQNREIKSYRYLKKSAKFVSTVGLANKSLSLESSHFIKDKASEVQDKKKKLFKLKSVGEIRKEPFCWVCVCPNVFAPKIIFTPLHNPGKCLMFSALSRA